RSSAPRHTLPPRSPLFPYTTLFRSLDELLLLRLRGTGHAGELLVEAEVVLQGDRGERDVLLLDPHALLRLDGLMQALAPAAAFQDRKSTRLNSSHEWISYAVFCLKK